ncbi:YoaK family protein [Nonomuraea sp. NPDC000554]|uniref:YoaK family protein n=1 Tax=Nonomuraea sp. NPDC000554 TaxID=3154259 RepID=UPI003333A3FF
MTRNPGRIADSLLLLGLTTVSGMVDAIAYLSLGHVFVANMTGNTVILGLAIGGTPDFSTLGCLVALVAFAAGAIVSGRLAKALHHRWLLISLLAESALLAAATAVAFADARAQYPIIAALGLAMGMRTATVRLAGVSDITTTVITSTLAWLGATSSLAGGDSAGAARRLGAIVVFLAGATAGAWLVPRTGPAVALLVATAVEILVTLAYTILPKPPTPSAARPR